MKTIKIEKVSNATKVTIVNDSITTEIHVVNISENFITDGSRIQFPYNTLLDKMNLNVNNLESTTATALGNPTDNYSLVSALAVAKLFCSEVA